MKPADTNDGAADVSTVIDRPKPPWSRCHHLVVGVTPRQPQLAPFPDGSAVYMDQPAFHAPTLAIALIICFLRNTHLMIDWHNYGWTILSGTRGADYPFVRISKAYGCALDARPRLGGLR
ncbi:chitobiosyldiphosphodolichol beta-mannosyltransferase [Apiospora sp. TS-2023a]